jgi:hypothetical protein
MMTGSILPAAYTTRCAGNIPISSLSCVMHAAVYWLAKMGLRFRQPQRQLGEIDRHPPQNRRHDYLSDDYGMARHPPMFTGCDAFSSDVAISRLQWGSESNTLESPGNRKWTGLVG